jgi:hypothetical protein
MCRATEGAALDVKISRVVGNSYSKAKPFRLNRPSSTPFWTIERDLRFDARGTRLALDSA